MAKQVSNKKEFEQNLKKLSDLYEEGKDLCAQLLPVGAKPNDMRNFNRMREVLKEIRNLAAVYMQKNHLVDEN